LQFGKDWGFAVRLVEHAASPNHSTDDASRGQRSEFPLHGAQCHPGSTDKLPDVKRLVDPGEEQPKKRLPGLAKQAASEGGRQRPGKPFARTHNAYNRTHFAYEGKRFARVL